MTKFFFALGFLLFQDVAHLQLIKVAHIEWRAVDLPRGRIESLAAFLLAEKRLRDEKIIPTSINFDFVWEPVESPKEITCPGAAARLYYRKNHTDWIIGPTGSTGTLSSVCCDFCLFHL